MWKIVTLHRIKEIIIYSHSLTFLLAQCYHYEPSAFIHSLMLPSKRSTLIQRTTHSMEKLVKKILLIFSSSRLFLFVFSVPRRLPLSSMKKRRERASFCGRHVKNHVAYDAIRFTNDDIVLLCGMSKK